jgi:hypothetical protein
VVVPTFGVGTTSPQIVVATKIDSNQDFAVGAPGGLTSPDR